MNAILHQVFSKQQQNQNHIQKSVAKPLTTRSSVAPYAEQQLCNLLQPMQIMNKTTNKTTQSNARAKIYIKADLFTLARKNSRYTK